MPSASDPVLLDALRQATPAETDRLMRQALAGLLRWQLDQPLAPPAATLQPLAAEKLQADLALFPHWCVRLGHGRSWGSTEQAIWERCAGLLVAQALAQPTIAVHGHWQAGELVRVDDGWRSRRPAAGHAGPVGQDLVTLLRDPALDADEAQELDWAVRWWDAARRGGLPVDPDFGECWRAHDALALLAQLVRLGEVHRQQHDSGQAADPILVARLLAGASRTALRYGPLTPLLRLLEPLSGTAVSAGYTF